ncbi:hypothetical protein BAR24_13895 [Gluconobacter oxydans]|uniref:DUF445 domain-containing protein n=1 Tax=Gluconobacter thailandicus TaxID=257438 RepID=UPI0002997C00|nr:DUF445 domain-containing protein [Gluconobacter thailandicus]AFW01976.1 putative membrane-spanning protein [Gluconobacter oxydans H24]ANQ42450.1 hypothetical protein BAR24_13895 [Gluconobacter oxydans]
MHPDMKKDVSQASAQRAASPPRLAGALLIGMGALATGTTYLAAHHVYDESWALNILRAGSRAGVVGGLADWFAVTALFRHPLGLPIPHTAILPRQKVRLGQALGKFVSGQFFTDADVHRALSKIDLPGLIADALSESSTRLTLVATLRASIPSLFDRLEDGRASAALSRALPVLLNGEEMAPLVSRAMRAMVDSEMHQEVLSFLLAKLKMTVAAKEGDLRQFVEERVREQGGRFIGWAIGGSVANRVLTALQAEIERIDPMDSDIRHGFTTWVRAEIDRMETDPDRRQDMTQAIGSVLTHSSLKAWSGELWDRVRRMAEQDCTKEDGWSASVLDTAIVGLASSMRENDALRERINQAVERMVSRLLPGVRDKLAGFIANVMAGWDGDDLAQRLEARVGRDLAYIRVNGTVVGFLAGAGLDVISRLSFGV